MVTINGVYVYDGFLGRDRSEMVRVLTEGLFENVPIELVGDGYSLEPGDTYLAQRNSGIHLLTCKKNDKERGWVVPVERAYLYDTPECYKIKVLI